MSVQDQPQSPSPDRASPYEIVGLGCAFVAAGLYFMLGSGGLLPMPEANGPAFVVFCAGAAFLFAGTYLHGARQGRHAATIRPMCPDHAAPGSSWPIACSASAWPARSRPSAPGSRSARARVRSPCPVPFGEMQTSGQTLGRTVFGLGAVIVWIYVIALTVGTVRKLFNRS